MHTYVQINLHMLMLIHIHTSKGDDTFNAQAKAVLWVLAGCAAPANSVVPVDAE